MTRRTGAAVITPAAKGRLQRASGETSESLFSRTHDRYRAMGRASIVKQYPPVFGVPGALQYADGAFVDYMGAMAPHGTLIAFDVKGCTGKPSLSPASLPSPVTNAKAYARAVKDRARLQRQAELMLSMRAMGACVAFFAVDLHREKVWIIEDVARIAALEPVVFRQADRDCVPSVPFATLAALATGHPPIDYLRVWPIP